MNIPQQPSVGLFGLPPIRVDATELGIHLAADLALTGAYLLTAVTVVYLNRQKHVSIYIPRQTVFIVFVLVLAASAALSVATFTAPGGWVLLAAKVLVTVMLLGIIIGVLRVLPRDVDPMEKARLSVENIELKEVKKALRRAEARLAEADGRLAGLVAERTRDLGADKLRLEKELIEQKLAEERSGEAKRRLEELIMRTSTALLVLDSEGQVLESNLALAQMLGRGSTDEVVGRELPKLLGLRDDTELRHFIREALRQGMFSAEFDGSPPDRGVVSFEASGVTTIFDNRTCIMAMMRDVTARRAAERQLLQSREALTAALDVTRKANATRSDFLAKMNHELRTPLNGIIGLAEIIRHKATGKTISGVEARKLATNIYQSGRHLLSVVDDLLDLSRLDAGTRELHPVEINVRSEIDAALVTLATIAEKKQIGLENKCPADLDWVADQRAFKQIVINLVNNAVKFSPSKSQVTVDVSHSAEFLSLHIRDQGPGISSRDRGRILEPFGRGEYAQSHKIDGVGLGLAIVSELLKLQGGRIEIDSEPDKGATFTAIFPMASREGLGARTPGA